jgi:hypothetical protein
MIRLSIETTRRFTPEQEERVRQAVHDAIMREDNREVLPIQAPFIVTVHPYSQGAFGPFGQSPMCLVLGHSGEYEDYDYWPVAAFASEADAGLMCKVLNDLADANKIDDLEKLDPQVHLVMGNMPGYTVHTVPYCLLKQPDYQPKQKAHFEQQNRLSLSGRAGRHRRRKKKSKR